MANKAPGDAYSDHELVAELDRIIEMGKTLDREAIDAVFGPLPDWLPEPVLPQIHQAVETLRNADQDAARIAQLVAQAREDRLEVPGTALDTMDFYKSAYVLARIQWALTLDKAVALRELAGTRAAKDYLRSKAGHEAQFGTSQQRQGRDRDISLQAAQLRSQNAKLSDNDIARRIAPQFGLSARQIKRILRGTRPNLKGG